MIFNADDLSSLNYELDDSWAAFWMTFNPAELPTGWLLKLCWIAGVLHYLQLSWTLNWITFSINELYTGWLYLTEPQNGQCWESYFSRHFLMQ